MPLAMKTIGQGSKGYLVPSFFAVKTSDLGYRVLAAWSKVDSGPLEPNKVKQTARTVVE